MNLATLDEVLDACGDRMLVNVEIKNWPTDAGFDPTMAMVAPIVEPAASSRLDSRLSMAHLVVLVGHTRGVSGCRAGDRHRMARLVRERRSDRRASPRPDTLRCIRGSPV